MLFANREWARLASWSQMQRTCIVVQSSASKMQLHGNCIWLTVIRGARTTRVDMAKNTHLGTFAKRKKALEDALRAEDASRKVDVKGAESAQKRKTTGKGGVAAKTSAPTRTPRLSPVRKPVSMPIEPHSRKPRKLPPLSEATRYVGGKRTILTEDLMLELCARIANGRPLTVTAKELNVPVSSVFEWAGKYAEFGEQFNKAREAGSEGLVDYATATLERVQDDDVQGPAVAAANALATHLRWVAAKLKPRVYGEAVRIDQTTELTVKDERAQLRDKILEEHRAVIEGESHREADPDGAPDARTQRTALRMVEGST